MDPVARKKKIGEILIEENLITPTQLKSALEEQKEWGGKLGAALVKIGAIAEEDLARILGIKLKVKWVAPSEILISDAALATMDASIASKYLVMPLHTDKRAVTVAMMDPTDLNMLDTLEFIVGKRIIPVISTGTEIKRAIARYYEGKDPDSVAGSRYKPAPMADGGEQFVSFGEEKIELPLALEGLIELMVAKGLISKEEYYMHLYRKDQGH